MYKRQVLSKIKFEKPNTVSVPILVSRLQAGAGLVNVGSVVDIYTRYLWLTVNLNIIRHVPKFITLLYYIFRDGDRVLHG